MSLYVKCGELTVVFVQPVCMYPHCHVLFRTKLCVFLTQTKTLGAKQPQGEYSCKDQNQHVPSPSKAGCQSVAAHLRASSVSQFRNALRIFFPPRKKSVNYKQPNFVIRATPASLNAGFQS